MRLLLLLCCLCAPDAFALSLAHSTVLCAIVDLPFAIKSIMLLYRSSRSPHTPSTFLILIIRSRFAFHSVRPPKAARLWHDARHTKWDVVNMSTIYAMERDTIDRSVLTAHPSQPLTLECILLVFLTGDLVRWKIGNIRPARGCLEKWKISLVCFVIRNGFFRCLVTSIVSSFAYAYNLSAWCFFLWNFVYIAKTITETSLLRFHRFWLFVRNLEADITSPLHTIVQALFKTENM